MWMLTCPGVYRPQADTWLLAEQLERVRLPSRAQVLDIGTGTGALALAAVEAGAAQVTALDRSARAVLVARLNARLKRLPIRVCWGGLDRITGRRFDVVLANPPYVPSRRTATRGAAIAWDAGPDGRSLLDPLCARAPGMLHRGGMLLLVQSALSGVQATLTRLRAGGLAADVIARRQEPFGPVLSGRAAWLESQGMIEPGQRHEELVVIRADRAA